MIIEKKTDRYRGMYQKYEVRRTDGSSEPGGKHDGCQYFVLDLTHDKYAGAAMMAYSRACYQDFPALSNELRVVAAGLISGIIPVEPE